MEELVVDIHVLVVDGAVECDGDHHGKLAQLQLAALHTWKNKKMEATTTLCNVFNLEEIITQVDACF
jgi:hypothetical protein